MSLMSSFSSADQAGPASALYMALISLGEGLFRCLKVRLFVDDILVFNCRILTDCGLLNIAALGGLNLGKVAAVMEPQQFTQPARPLMLRHRTQ